MLGTHSLSRKSYIVPIEFTYGVLFASNAIFVLIGSMNPRKNVSRRLEEEVADAGAAPHNEKVPPLEEKTYVDQASANPEPMMEAEMSPILDQRAQSMTTQAKSTTVHVHSMTAQANTDITPRPHQQVNTMASRLRDFS